MLLVFSYFSAKVRILAEARFGAESPKSLVEVISNYLQDLLRIESDEQLHQI